MPEYMGFRCCMCPQRDNDSPICPDIAGTPHPDSDPCRFVKQYVDDRGWQYFVRGGIGGEQFKTFYRKPGKSAGGHGWRSAPLRNSFDEAQADLNREAKRRGWNEC